MIFANLGKILYLFEREFRKSADSKSQQRSVFAGCSKTHLTSLETSTAF